MEIKKAQKDVEEYHRKIGYYKIEDTASKVFLHLIEEAGELGRSVLHRETERGKYFPGRAPDRIDEEVADVFLQVLRLANMLNVDLESAFVKKFEKNRRRPKVIK